MMLMCFNKNVNLREVPSPCCVIGQQGLTAAIIFHKLESFVSDLHNEISLCSTQRWQGHAWYATGMFSSSTLWMLVMCMCTNAWCIACCCKLRFSFGERKKTKIIGYLTCQRWGFYKSKFLMWILNIPALYIYCALDIYV